MSKKSLTILKLCGRCLLVLLYATGFCCFVFLAGFRGYIVPSDNGPRLHLPLLLQKDDVAPVISPITITTGDSSDDPLKVALLSTDEIDDGTALPQLESLDVNAFMVPLRTEDGSLSFVSYEPLAIDAKASYFSPERNQSIMDLTYNSNLYSIALFSCFPDKALSAYDPDLALNRLQGVPFQDRNAMPWLSADQEDVQSYLTNLCLEIKQLGFDEIILDNYLYPETGDNEQTFICSQTQTASLAHFYDQLQLEANKHDLAVSILLPSDAKEDALLQTLLLSAHRVWVADDIKDAEQLFAQYECSFARTGKMQNSEKWLAFSLF